LPDARFVGRVNCDSIEDLRSTLTLLRDGRVSFDVLGIRLAPFSFASRFGVNTGDPAQFVELSAILRTAPEALRLGVHFHCAPTSVGSALWLQEVRSMLRMARSLQDAVGRSIVEVDLGGGWRDASDPHTRSALLEAIRAAQLELRSLDTVVLEPGKSIAEPSMAVLGKVLQIRHGSPQSVVLSIAVSDVPDHSTYPHDVWWRSQKTHEWRPLADGRDQIFGRTCMENDIIRFDVALPAEMREGDAVAILNAGGYDSSMSYSFGRGAEA